MIHFVQLWIDLPQEKKMVTPNHKRLSKDSIPEVAFDGGKVRIIA